MNAWRGAELPRRLTAALAAVPESARTPPPGGRAAAVLVLLSAGPDGPRLVLTRRRDDLRSHPGQVALPGGRIEPGETPTAAALREASEEVGLDADGVALLGTGPSFHVPPSRFWIVPVVAWWERPHPLRPDPTEVAAILEVALADLADPERFRRTPGVGRGRAGWAWRLRSGDLLWGATALVVGGLLDVLDPTWHGGVTPDDLPGDREERPWEHAPRGARPSRLGALPERPQAGLPHADAAAVRALRRLLTAGGLDPALRAGRAGAAVALAASRLAGAAAPVTVLSGGSASGAVGLAAAVSLAEAGHPVEVVALGPARLPSQLDAVRAAGVAVRAAPSGAGAAVVDAMLGAATVPPLHGAPAEAVRWLRRHDVPVLSVEVPSGFGADLGPAGPCVAADATVALGLPLRSCALPAAQVFLGDLVVADLGADAATWARAGVPGVPADLFAAGALVRLTEASAGGDAGTPLQVAEDEVREEVRGGVRAVGVEPTLGGF